MPRDHIDLLISRLRPSALIPTRGTPASSGLDLYACLDAPVTLTQAPQLVSTGVAIEAPAGYDAQVRPRSGLSLQGVAVAFGTVDADYRGELLVTMSVVGGRSEHVVEHGDRIAQLVLVALPEVTVVEVPALSPTERGEGGHGSTGR